MSKEAGRVGWVDDAKGLGILLVVFGHVWQGLHSARMELPHYQAVDSWIYAFHMPLFFLLSGLFIEHSARKPARAFLLEKIGALAYPYFLWTLLQWSAARFAAGAVNTPAKLSDLTQCPWIPYDQFWFLYVLFFASLIALAAYRLPLGSIILMAFAVAFYLCPANFDWWKVLYELKYYLLFFSAGALFSQTLLKRLPKLKNPPLLILSLICVAALTYHVWQHRGTPWFNAALGIMGILAISVLIDHARWRPLKFIGALSLPIYVAHVIFSAATRAALIRVLHIHNVPLHLIAGTVAGVVGPVALALVARWIRFPYLFSLRLK